MTALIMVWQTNNGSLPEAVEQGLINGSTLAVRARQMRSVTEGIGGAAYRYVLLQLTDCVFTEGQHISYDVLGVARSSRRAGVGHGQVQGVYHNLLQHVSCTSARQSL